MEHYYKKIQGWFRFRSFYDRAILAVENGSHFVEIGAWKGKSSIYMAVEIINSGKKIKFDVVDHWLGSDEIAHHNDICIQQGNLYETFIENIKPVAHIINPLRMSSEEASLLYKNNSLDFVLIDASHDYESVKKDLECWWPKIKHGGFIAGDDYRWSGVNRAVHEFFSNDQIKLNEAKVCWFVDKL